MFCRNCGKELCDEEFVCPQCGDLVNENTQKTKKELIFTKCIEEKELNKKKLLVKIFLLVSFGLMCVALSLMISALSTYKIDVTVGQNIAGLYSWGEIYISYGALVWIAFGAEHIAVIAGIVSFIIALKMEKDETLKIIATMNFICNCCFVLVCYVIPCAV